MPTADQHRRKAEKNRRLLAALDVTDHPEWVVTVAFYTALHRVEQLRRKLGDGDSQDHSERLDYLSAVHQPIYDPFKWLYVASRLARYESASNFFAHYDPDRVRDEVIAVWLATVEAYVDQQLAPPEAAP